MSKAKFKYQTIQVQNRIPFVAGRYARGTKGAVRLLHAAMDTINDFTIALAVNRELNKKIKSIERVMEDFETRIGQCRFDTGVLIVIGFQEWRQPDSTGMKARLFLSLHIGGVGTNLQRVYQKISKYT